MPGEAWAPTLADVARHIPTRTRDTKTPGSDTLLGTFTTATTPTNDQAQAIIDGVVGSLLAASGPLPADNADLLVSARIACEWRAAADIDIAYPYRDADVSVYAQLDARAKVAWDQFMENWAQLGGGTSGPDEVPEWCFPPPYPLVRRKTYIDGDLIPPDLQLPAGWW